MEQTSIQGFYSREVKGLDEKEPISSHAPVGDGFTSCEVQDFLRPQGLGPWHPQHEYEETNISALQVGTSRVMLTGRVVNFYSRAHQGVHHPRPKGFIKLFLKDDTGILSVKLWYSKVKFDIELGQLVSVWAVHVNVSDPSTVSMSNRYLHVNLFPEADRSCHFMILNNSDDGKQCKKPIHYKPKKPLPRLIALKNFNDGGHEMNDCKVLLCVKSIGQRKKVTTRKGTDREREADKLDIVVFDDTLEATLTLWDQHCSSATPWQPSSTILLLTNLAFKGDRQVGLDLNTCVEIDPAMDDADWLREHAKNKSKREHVNLPFPEGAFDVEAATTSEVRILFRFADIDEWVRVSPETYVGYFSVVLTEMNLTKLHQRGMLCSGECCNMPVYANAINAKCKHCDRDLALRPNPRLIGPLADETGSIATGKTILSDDAWEQLLGRNAAELVAESHNRLKELEHRMLFLRVTMLMGWSPSVGKLVVLRISA